MKKTTILWLLAAITLPAMAATSLTGSPTRTNGDKILGKLSPRLRQLATGIPTSETGQRAKEARPAYDGQRVTVFVKTATDDDRTWQEMTERHDCRRLAHFGTLSILEMPIGQLADMARRTEVERIEAGRSCTALMDTTALFINTPPVHEGRGGLPQAFTGKGTVMGIVDIGFDLTHPNFYSRDRKHYRIKRLWDQLSTDTVGSPMPVGRCYDSEQDILALQHSRDGLIATHGTHTLGIAAGSGYDTPYVGVAYESDICAVANAVTNNASLIDPKDYDRYTTATDALAFKYIFDYAQNAGKPCVISFSEGATADLEDEDRLYRQFLDSLCGPGRIIVAAAGNEGLATKHLHKPAGTQRGTFLQPADQVAAFSLRTDAPLTIRTVIYGTESNDTVITTIPHPSGTTDDPIESTDSVTTEKGVYRLSIRRFTSCFDSNDTACEYMMETPVGGSAAAPVSIELVGYEADADAFAMSGTFATREDINPALNDADNRRCILCPGDAPGVICVGASAYRKGVVNAAGQWVENDAGKDGLLIYSSTGPAIDGGQKPDVIAPGMHVISSYNSFYMDGTPNSYDIQWCVGHSTFQGRSYPWNANMGTSMSAPAVAGVIALWLEADPTLTPQDVRDIISRTSRKTGAYDVPDYRYGYGEIDAYKGLLSVLKLTCIKDIPTQQSCVEISGEGNRLIVEMPADDCPTLELTLYSLGGVVVMQCHMEGGQHRYEFTLPPLPAGIYAAKVSGDKRLAGSRLIRL